MLWDRTFNGFTELLNFLKLGNFASKASASSNNDAVRHIRLRNAGHCEKKNDLKNEIYHVVDWLSGVWLIAA